MLEQLKAFASVNKFYQYSSYSKTLAAATPGVDSVVMCYLLKEAGWLAGIAHCNFQLHEKDSDSDERFVKKLAKTLEVPFFTARFDTKDYAEVYGITQQSAARRLRYAWLEQVRQSENFHRVATSHHGDEALEEMLLNITKGAGLQGLAGVMPIRENVIRPLLFAFRKDILAYAEEHGLSFRKDRHEFHHDGVLAKIRKVVVPAFEEFDPNFRENVRQTVGRLHQAQMFFDDMLLYRTGMQYNTRENRVELSPYYSRDKPYYEESIYRGMRKYGFNYEQCVRICAAAKAIGYGNNERRIYHSATHKAEVTHSSVFMKPLNERGEDIVLNRLEDSPVQLSNGLLHMRVEEQKPSPPPRERGERPNIQIVDADKVTFPLTLRRWRASDVIYSISSLYSRTPTLHEYFGNRKVNATEREKYWIVWCKNEIVAIAGFEEDARYTPGYQTKRYLVITWQDDVMADEEF